MGEGGRRWEKVGRGGRRWDEVGGGARWDLQHIHCCLCTSSEALAGAVLALAAAALPLLGQQGFLAPRHKGISPQICCNQQRCGEDTQPARQKASWLVEASVIEAVEAYQNICSV